MDKAWLFVIPYVLAFVSILTAVHYWLLSRERWEQMRDQKQWIDNTLYDKNAEISEAKMQVDNSRADIIRLCAVIETKNAEIEELMPTQTRHERFAVKGA